jgi:hypothetical protein
MENRDVSKVKGSSSPVSVPEASPHLHATRSLFRFGKLSQPRTGTTTDGSFVRVLLPALHLEPPPRYYAADTVTHNYTARGNGATSVLALPHSMLLLRHSRPCTKPRHEINTRSAAVRRCHAGPSPRAPAQPLASPLPLPLPLTQPTAPDLRVAQLALTRSTPPSPTRNHPPPLTCERAS